MEKTHKKKGKKNNIISFIGDGQFCFTMSLQQKGEIEVMKLILTECREDRKVEWRLSLNAETSRDHWETSNKKMIILIG